MDRNIVKSISYLGCFRSLSARRAWIEMLVSVFTNLSSARSLSARRAWIEIVAWLDYSDELLQSLSARRAWIEITGCPMLKNSASGRSPQGERG